MKRLLSRQLNEAIQRYHSNNNGVYGGYTYALNDGNTELIHYRLT